MGSQSSSRPWRLKLRKLVGFKGRFCQNGLSYKMFGLSKLVPAFRVLARPAIRQQTQIRKGSSAAWRYREINTDISPKTKLKAEMLGGLMWYWILWHMWYQWDHFLGHGVPDPRKWTNAELGIPGDDYD